MPRDRALPTGAPGSPTSTRMPAADAVWLGLDAPDNLMMITGVIRFDAPADWQLLRAAVESRLVARYPAFSRRPVPSGWSRGWSLGTPLRRPAWRDDPAFDLDAHLVRTTIPRADVAGLVSELLGTPLDLTRSPWQFHLVDIPADDEGPAGSAIVARLHHCIADGIALASVLLTLTDHSVTAADPEPDHPEHDHPERDHPGPAHRAAAVLRAVRFGLAVVGTATRLLLLSADPRTRLRGRLGAGKRAAWAPPVPLDDVKRVAASLGASVNDVLLAATAGALRRHLLGHGEPAHDVRVFVPVNLRPADAPVPRTLGNRFGLVLVSLPVAEPDPVARVRRVHRATGRVRGRQEAAATFVLISLLGVLPRWLRELLVAILGAKTSAVVTNVPGPRRPVQLAGARVDRIVFWVPQTASVGLGVSLFSYAGQVGVGVAADAGLVPDPQAVADDVAAELATLVGLTRTPQPHR